jgi:Secretory lipase
MPIQTGIDYAFRHLQPYFKNDLNQMVQAEPFKTILAAQRIGNVKPTGPVYISHNRWDPFGPYAAVVQTAKDWCAQGADVTLWTNEQPPFLNKTDVNALLPAFVDGERSMTWITDRVNGVPTAPNCGDI